MQSVAVVRWAAWAPGLESREAWTAWCRQPHALGTDGAPDAGFLPPLVRRRCGRLSRMMLTAAAACGTREELAAVPTVFASRHGDVTATVALLECLAREEAVSANRFSHSVHNTQAGLFSIVAGNREPASAVAAGRNTFTCAFVEALAAIQRSTVGRALLVVGEEPLPSVFRPFVDEPQAAYATAFLLEASAADQSIALVAEPPDVDTPAVPLWPVAAEFLRWALSVEPTLTLAPARGWRWRRGEPIPEREPA